MIEGGVAGGSARQQAAQRRATAERLLIEASWLEGLADDELSMAGRLAELPPAYSILHDLRLPGSKGNIDHLIVGPGGAFVVLTRRCSDTVEFRDGQLWSGEQSLGDVLGAARVESQLLTQTLATPVVPVVALLDAVLPAATPTSIDGVLVCTGELVVRVVTRGWHTHLPPDKVVDAAERALPLLHNPGSAPRTESALGVRADPAPDTSVNPVVPPRPPSAEHVQRRRAAEQAAGKSARRNGNGNGSNGNNNGDGGPRAKPGAEPVVERARTKESSGRARSVRFIAVALVSLSLGAVALGTLIRMIWRDGDDDPASDRSAATTTIALESTAGALADAVSPPTAAFDAVCPVAGAGWQLQPSWPGDVAGLAQYEVEIESLDSTWRQLPPISSADSPWDGLTEQPANATYTVRITAVMTDDSRRAGAATVITAPTTAC